MHHKCSWLVALPGGFLPVILWPFPEVPCAEGKGRFGRRAVCFMGGTGHEPATSAFWPVGWLSATWPHGWMHRGWEVNGRCGLASRGASLRAARRLCPPRARVPATAAISRCVRFTRSLSAHFWVQIGGRLRMVVCWLGRGGPSPGPRGGEKLNQSLVNRHFVPLGEWGQAVQLIA